MIFYFSGTGNSKWVAEQLSKEQSEKLVFIPDAIKDGINKFVLEKEEKIGFVFPVYSWGPPSIVLQFIRILVLQNYHFHYLFFVCSCGDDIGLTQQVIAKALLFKGWMCHSGFSVIMPNNYVLFPKFDVDTKEMEIKKLENAVPALVEINRLITMRQHLFRCKEGSFPFIKTRIINPLFNRYQISPKPFNVTDACVACKRCERACPIENIKLFELKPVWGINCTSCLACYHVCPQRAIQYGKKTQNKRQYFNPNI